MSIESYRTDLACIHDVGHGAIARDAAARLIDELASFGGTGTVVDVGCGSGILAQAVTGAGFHVLGLDVSEAMVALARTRAPAAEFRIGSFVTAIVPDCVAVAAVGDVLSYAFDAANDDRERAHRFRRVYGALQPGGVLLFDIAGPRRAPLPDRSARSGRSPIGRCWSTAASRRRQVCWCGRSPVSGGSARSIDAMRRRIGSRSSIPSPRSRHCERRASRRRRLGRGRQADRRTAQDENGRRERFGHAISPCPMHDTRPHANARHRSRRPGRPGLR
jgi:SAM-dependent methyltransferase